MIFGRRGAALSDKDLAKVSITALERIAKKYPRKGTDQLPLTQNFHTFRQALNVASGDQRLLLFVTTKKSDQKAIRRNLTPVMADPNVVGKFHLDFFSKSEDADWRKAVSGTQMKEGIVIIQSSKFGTEGKVLKELKADSTPTEIRAALLAANATFAKSEERKSYGDHISQGRRARVHFENEMEYGEDRDGDGKIDQRRGRR